MSYFETLKKRGTAALKEIKKRKSVALCEDDILAMPNGRNKICALAERHKALGHFPLKFDNGIACDCGFKLYW